VQPVQLSLGLIITARRKSRGREPWRPALCPVAELQRDAPSSWLRRTTGADVPGSRRVVQRVLRRVTHLDRDPAMVPQLGRARAARPGPAHLAARRTPASSSMPPGSARTPRAGS